jgi:glycolate oxidase FAD binding subunit
MTISPLPTASDPTSATHPTPGAAEIAEHIHGAIAAGTSLRVVGSGLWLDAGGTSPATSRLSVRPIAGIVDFIPGDLTLTARAGTTLGEIAAVTGAEGLWLPLDPAGTDDGTIGATVATASAGALSTGFGGPRDMVLGVEAVTGRGSVIRGGGRVVKNVAGFDLTRMLTGSWGTLGVLTEVSVRVRARPARDETVAIPFGDSSADLERVRRMMRGWPFTPIAAEALNAALSRSVTGSPGPVVLFRLAGNDEAVRAQRAAVGALGDVVDLDVGAWTRLRGAETATASVFRISALPTRLPELWTIATEIASRNPGTMVHAAPARGVVRCIVPQTEPMPSLAPLDAIDATVIYERLPRDLVPRLTAPRSSLGIEQRLLAMFNPFGVLNPGLLIDGGGR